VDTANRISVARLARRLQPVANGFERIAWPFALRGDKGYRADWIDQHLLDLVIEPVIPSKENEDRDARPIEFDREVYRRRNIVERLIG
jgi:hypothetical protein